MSPTTGHPRTSRTARMLAALTLVLIAVGCDERGTGAHKSTAEPDVMSHATIDDSFAISGGSHLALRCFGHGKPAIILVAGDDSTGDVFPVAFVRPMAGHRLTCTYDRLGTGTSDPPAERRRTIDNVVADLDQLLDAARVSAPLLLVGSSGGGNIAVQYAVRHADRVAGLVLLDVAAPTADLGEEFPGALGWKNPEHIDWVNAELRQTKLQMPIGTFPVLIVTADAGQSDRNDQAYWLRLSPKGEQIVMPGGHDLYQETPEAVAKQVLTTLASD